MIYATIDTFYLTEDQLSNSPSRKDGIDEAAETSLRIYGCDLIQESGILLRLPQAVMATGQVLFHRFYCKKSFVRFSVKRVAASCVWLASKLEESPRKAKHVIIVFHRIECRREGLPIEHLDISSKKYSELKNDLIRTERHLLKEMGFVCHVEHPHKFISNYLATLETPPELRQEAWNLANDSLRTTLCVRFKSEVVACGVVYAAARRFQIPLPENPPWWLAFDANQTGIEEVCRVLAHLYTLPKASYIPVYKDYDSFTSSKTPDSRAQTPRKESNTENIESGNGGSPKDPLVKAVLEKLKESKRSADGEAEEAPEKVKGDHKSIVESTTGVVFERSTREKPRTKSRSRDGGRGVDSSERGEGERDEEVDRDRERRYYKERAGIHHHSTTKKEKASSGPPHSEKPRHHLSSRDHRSEYHHGSSHSSRGDKAVDRHRHYTSQHSKSDYQDS